MSEHPFEPVIGAAGKLVLAGAPGRQLFLTL